MSYSVHFAVDELAALARADLENGRLEEGLTKLKRLLLAPNTPQEAIRLAGHAYVQLGLHDRAQVLLQRYLLLQPDAVEERFQLGLARYGKKEIEEAIDCWHNLLVREPGHCGALYFLGRVNAEREQLDEARGHLEKLVSCGCTNPHDNQYFERSRRLLGEIELRERTRQSLPSREQATLVGHARHADSMPQD